MKTYSEYIAENIDKVISYSEYIAEHLDKSIDYAEYVAEQLNKSYQLNPHYKEMKLREDSRKKIEDILGEDIDGVKNKENTGDIKKDLIYGFDLK
jgi:hypothetical protein